MLAMLPMFENLKQATTHVNIHPAFYVANWIFFSSVVILFNKWIISSAGFPYPVFLTFWHMLFATIMTQVLARTTTLLDGRKNVPMTGRIYLRAIVPIGLLYSLSLVCSNLTYLYLSVAFIQMLKAAAPAAVLVTGYAFGVEKPNLGIFVNVCIIVAGVALASYGEIEFSFLGFMYQLGGLFFEAIRLIMVQKLLMGNAEDPAAFKMDPLVSLFYYAPVCAGMNLVVTLFAEGPSFKFQDLVNIGPWILLTNAAVAFLLNAASVFLIGKTSGLVLTLCGALKNILIVAISVVIWGTIITGLQIFGYGIATLGLIYYGLGWKGVNDLWNNIKERGENAGLRGWKLNAALGAGALMFFILIVISQEGTAVSTASAKGSGSGLLEWWRGGTSV